MTYIEFPYSLKVWFSTLAAAPILFFIGMIITGEFAGDHQFLTLSELPVTWLILFFAGCIFSFFTFGLFYMTVKTVTNNMTRISGYKSVISLICVLLIMATFAATSSTINQPFLDLSGYFPLCYYASAAGFCWFYDLAKPVLTKEEPLSISSF